MRKIKASQIVLFMFLLAIILTLSVGTAIKLFGWMPLGDFRGIIIVICTIVTIYLYAFVCFRLFLYFFPLKSGIVAPGSQQEFVYHIYLLFFLMIFYPAMRSGFLPVPLMRLVYLALGAKLGVNTYSSGILFDPPFVKIGSNSLIGQDALIIPHSIENDRLAHYPIRIGNNVTIGAKAVVLGGATINDGAVVAIGAVVKKGAVVGVGEVWGGIPAKIIGTVVPGKSGI